MPSLGEVIKPSKDNLYFSYWSWHILKECPQAYKLIVIDQKRPTGPRDTGNAIQGSIPDKMAEIFFNLKPDERDVNYFLSPKEFQFNWDKFLGKERVDWIKQARRYAKKRPALKADIPNELTAEQEAHWAAWAMKLKKAETETHVQNLVKLITLLGLEKKPTQSQVGFRVVVEPAKSQDGVDYPPLTIGGLIDLVVTDDSFTDIWDVKAVEKPKELDIDQLIFYRMALRAQGKIIRTVGYMQLYGNKPYVDPRRVTDSHEIQLRSFLRTAREYFVRDTWPANWRSFWCGKGYCDVAEFCKTHQMRTAGMAEIANLKPGKVSF